MKSIKFNLKMLLLFLLIITSSIKAQTTISIRLGPETGQDAYIGDNYLYTNWGALPDNLATGWTRFDEAVVGRSLIKFYYSIPNNATIIDAKLSLYGNPTPINPNHYGENKAYLRRIVSPWDGNTVNWSTHPDYITTHQVMLPASTSPMQDYLNINVTELVRDMVNHPTESFGFILMLNTEWLYRSMNFASSECAEVSKRPLLQITYTTNVGIEPISSITPSSYKIYQNYPNPFNPVTNIKFDLIKNTYTLITIYNMLGKKIETLVNDNLPAGTYNINWDGAQYASGEYIYRIVTSDFTESKKMSLIK